MDVNQCKDFIAHSLQEHEEEGKTSESAGGLLVEEDWGAVVWALSSATDLLHADKSFALSFC